MFDPNLLYTKIESRQVLLVGHGVPGFREKLQFNDNLVVVNPMTSDNSKNILKRIDQR
jgi:hypothetical protein